MTRVFIAADSPVVRAGLEALVRASPDLEVVGRSHGLVLLEQDVEDAQSDVVLLELELNNDDPLPDAVRALAEGPHACAIVVLANKVHGAWTAEALRLGVRAVLPWEVTGEEIAAAVQAAAVGLVALHRDAIEPLVSDAPSAIPALPQAQDRLLTPREIEVLGMLAEGLGNKTIASRLGISEHTVKFHIASIFTKLNVSSRTEAVTTGIRQGLIML